MKKIIVLLCLCAFTWSTNAAEYTIPDSGNTVGEFTSVITKKGDTLNRLAVRHGVGYNEMVKANRSWKGRKIPSGVSVTLPTKYELPSKRNGIVINISDMRLFYFSGNGVVNTFPIAVGKRGWSTPTGNTSVVAKRKNPTWTPPKSIRREAARRGKKLRKVYRAGPNNPLGTRALRLGIRGYLIHGTNKPYSIGKRVSHGCIRMRKNDVESLFSMVPVETSVNIISKKSSIDYPNSSNNNYVSNDGEVPQKSYKSRKKSRNSKPKKKRASRKRENNTISKPLNYQQIQRQIESGELKPIDLSGI